MKGIGIIAFGTLAAGLAVFSGPAPGGDARVMVVPPETPEPLEAEPEPQTQAFTDEQLLRLRELRAWLAQRRLQREDGIFAEPRRLPPNLAVYPDRQILTPLGQRYALGFQNRRGDPNRGNPALHFGRGPDGRIYHRYQFGSAEASPDWGGRDDPRRDAGTVGSRQGTARIWTPEPRQRQAAPQPEYDLRDSRP